MLSQARMKAVASFPMESICSSPGLAIILPTATRFATHLMSYVALVIGEMESGDHCGRARACGRGGRRYCVEELSGAGGLGEESMCPLRLGVSPYLHVYNTGMEYHPTVRATVTDCSQEFHPIHVRHINVGEYHIELCLLHVTYRVEPIIGRLDVVASRR